MSGAYETKFTSGPWEVVPDERTRFNGYMDALDIVGFDIRATGRKEIVGSEGIGASEEDLANAELIAAAPDLYAAAQCAANVLTLLAPAVDALGLRAGSVREMLRAALAKARGEA